MIHAAINKSDLTINTKNRQFLVNSFSSNWIDMQTKRQNHWKRQQHNPKEQRMNGFASLMVLLWGMVMNFSPTLGGNVSPGIKAAIGGNWKFTTISLWCFQDMNVPSMMSKSSSQKKLSNKKSESVPTHLDWPGWPVLQVSKNWNSLPRGQKLVFRLEMGHEGKSVHLYCFEHTMHKKMFSPLQFCFTGQHVGYILTFSFPHFVGLNLVVHCNFDSAICLQFLPLKSLILLAAHSGVTLIQMKLGHPDPGKNIRLLLHFGSLNSISEGCKNLGLFYFFLFHNLCKWCLTDLKGN